MVGNDENLVYNVAQVHQLLGLSRASVYEAIRRHELPVLKIGRRLLVPRAALEHIIAQAGAMPGTSDKGAVHDTRPKLDDEP